MKDGVTTERSFPPADHDKISQQYSPGGQIETLVDLFEASIEFAQDYCNYRATNNVSIEK